MNHINAINSKGETVKVYPQNVKGINKEKFLKKFSKHFAYPEQVYNKCVDARKNAE